MSLARPISLARARKFVFLAAVILAAPFCFAADNVFISEVYYDPIATESGGEVIELYNPSDSSVDIGGWILSTETSSTDATVPSGTTMPPHSFYLVADSGWSSSKDNTSWPDADHEEPISLTNFDAGVALNLPNGTTVDAVGWGDPLNIDSGLFEGTPASQVSEGESIVRSDLSDSDDNFVDFTASVPGLQNSDFVEDSGAGDLGDGINVSVNISNTAPSVDEVLILNDEVSSDPGVQISPVPGQDKEVEVHAVVSDPDGVLTLSSVSAELLGEDIPMSEVQVINSTASEFAAVFQLPFHQLGGNYTVTVNASDSVISDSAASGFELLSMAAVSIDTVSLSFEGAVLGSISEILGDVDMETSSPTVRNTGNTLLDLGVYGSDLVDGEKSIPVSSMKYSFDNDFGSSMSGTLSSVAQTVSVGLSVGSSSTIPFGLQLDVPSDAESGSYQGEVFLAAVGE